MKQNNPNILPATFILLTLFFSSSFAAKSAVYSTRIVHRFSVKAQKGSNGTGTGTTSFWPEKKRFEHMRMLLGSDLKRQRLKLLLGGSQNQVFVGSEQGRTFDFGNDMGWLHYTWIDIGTPSNSYLVALDTGSDMLWVPCDCTQCAPLTLSNSNMLDKELKEYRPSHSSSSKHVPCNHELCEMRSKCKSQETQCPYSVSYLSDDTSSSGFLYEDQLHLVPAGENGLQNALRATIILGCGSKQTGDYLEGIAPDGVLGLGPGSISITSSLVKSGLVMHSFSFCYDKNYTGRLYFGDQGPASQKSTSFLPLKGNSIAYIVEVETCCVGSSCLNQSGFKAQVDTGSSFTYLPSESYQQIVSEFQKQVNAPRISTQGFENCYKASSLKVSTIPRLKLLFPKNQTFVIEEPMFYIADDQGGLYCLGILSVDDDYGLIGQNFMMGYRVVFDWEKLKLGWSISTCQDVSDDGKVHSMPPSNPLPTNDQQSNPHKHGVSPAVAVLAPPKPSAASEVVSPYNLCKIFFLPLLWITCVRYLF